MDERQALARCPLFAGLDGGALDALQGAAPPLRRKLAREEYLLRPGERTGRLGVVVRGRLHILQEDAFGHRAILSDIPPGDCFAEAYACAGAPLAVGVMAGEESQVLLFSLAELLAAPEPGRRTILANLAGLLARKNLRLSEKMRHLTRRTTREKLLSYLSAQRQRCGRDSFTIPFDRQQLADYLAVDRSAMCTQLGRLRREGLLSCRGRGFTLHITGGQSGEGALQSGEKHLK